MASLTRHTVDTEHFVTRYVQGRLSEAELDAFEELCVMNPDVAKQVAVDRRMIQGMRGLKLVAPTSARHWVTYALAASLIAVALAISLSSYFSSAGQNALYANVQDVPSRSPGILATAVRVTRLRGIAVQTISIRPGTRILRLTIVPSRTQGAAAVDVALFEKIEEKWLPRGRVAGIRPNVSDGMVSVVTDLTQLKSARLRVTLESADGRLDEFDLRVELAE